MEACNESVVEMISELPDPLSPAEGEDGKLLSCMEPL